MIKPAYNRFWVRFILFFISVSLKMQFAKMVFRGEFTDKGKPVLMIANHFSWWDGFIQSFLNLKIFKRRMFFMMLEPELQKRMFLRRAGAYSVAKGSRSIMESLNFTIELLREKRNMVLIFPQGKLESMHVKEVRFEKGVEYILKKVKNECQIVFNVNLIDYFSGKKPVINVYYSSCEKEPDNATGIAAAFQEFYNRCKLEQVKL